MASFNSSLTTCESATAKIPGKWVYSCVSCTALPSANQKATLNIGERLGKGSTLQGAGKLTYLAMQSDGNMVVYQGQGLNQPVVWSSSTHNIILAKGLKEWGLYIRGGNLVLLSEDEGTLGEILWDGSTQGNPGTASAYKNVGPAGCTSRATCCPTISKDLGNPATDGTAAAITSDGNFQFFRMFAANTGGGSCPRWSAGTSISKT